jgi:2-hydroxy-3-keto-5-methylthiopentenyl-1-phosphate phosphatase
LPTQGRLEAEAADFESTGSVIVSTARVKCRVLVDFDGTIAPIDTTDLLLETYALPEWRLIEEDWKAGRIGSRECLVRQIDLVRATPAQMDSFIDGLQIDTGFARFVNLVEHLGHSVAVVSDGLDRTINNVLERNDIDVPHFANHLEWRGGDRWRLSFPYARSDCSALSGNCKCAFAEGQPRQLKVLVGDGRSDFCLAGRADLVLAKSSLLKHCRANDLPHIAFDNFEHATVLLARWLSENVTEPAMSARASKTE